MKLKRGFTIIEALIAIFLIVILLVSIFGMFASTRRSMQLSENHVKAAFFGQNLLENIRRFGFDNISPTPTTGTYTFAGLDNGKPFSQLVNYSINVTNQDTDKKLVWVTLTWTEATGNKQVILETLLVKL